MQARRCSRTFWDQIKLFNIYLFLLRNLYFYLYQYFYLVIYVESNKSITYAIKIVKII